MFPDKNSIVRDVLDEDFETLVEKVKAGYKVDEDDNKALRIAVVIDNVRIAKFLIENGADVNAKRMEPLQEAVARNNFEMASMLIDHGALVIKIMLDMAYAHRNDRMAELLINAAAAHV